MAEIKPQNTIISIFDLFKKYETKYYHYCHTSNRKRKEISKLFTMLECDDEILLNEFDSKSLKIWRNKLNEIDIGEDRFAEQAAKDVPDDILREWYNSVKAEVKPFIYMLATSRTRIEYLKKFLQLPTEKKDFR